MRLKTRRATFADELADSSFPETPRCRGPLDLIDDALGRFVARRVVSAAEVVDVLLDLRSAVMFDAAFAAILDKLEVG